MTVEEKLYQAIHRRTGAKLTFDDVLSLVQADDAIETRITNYLLGWDLGCADLGEYKRSLSEQKKHLRSKHGSTGNE